MNKKTIGVDIGATKTHVGLVCEGEIIQDEVFPTSSHAPEKQIIDELISGIEKLMQPEVEGIGIGAPGLIDEENGIVFGVQNIPSWKNVALKKILEDHFKKRVEITNDANTFVLGEKIYGKGKGYKNLVGMTLGSGLGGGIIVNAQLHSGSFSSAGEIGGVPYLDQTAEDYCSGKFFKNHCNVDGNEVLQRAMSGDPEALEIFRAFGHHVGSFVKFILFILSPQAIFLGGSVTKSYRFFKDGMHEALQSFPFKKVLDQLVIEPSELKNPAVLGAAALLEMRRSAHRA